MGRYQAYPEYQSSDCKWFDKIPSTWSMSPLKALVEIVNGSTPKSDVVEYWDGNVSWITPADMGKKNSPFIDYGARNITVKGYESCGTSIVPTGSIVLSSRAPIGTLAIALNELCTNQGCKSLVTRGKVNNKFLYYSLHCSTKPLNILGRGTTFLELSTDELARFVIPTPSICEQETIANFLDHETAKIDTLIKKQQQLIQLLKEKRQAVISHAVTKGLNPNAPMKDSGVEWLGEVPEHWIVAQLKFNTLEMQTGPFGSQLHAEDYVDDGIPLVNPAHMIEGKIVPDYRVSVDSETWKRLNRHQLKEGEIIFARRGDLGRCAIVTKEQEGWLCGTGSLKAKLNHCLSSEYAYLLITSDGVISELSLESKGSTMENLNTETLGRVRLPVPPQTEQIDILNYVHKVSGKYEALIEKAISAIQLMQERRTALISAAVTGKIDVRNWQAHSHTE